MNAGDKEWKRTKIKFATVPNRETLREDFPEDRLIKYIEISDVAAGGSIASKTCVAFGEAPSRARRVVQDGDTIVSTVRTYLKAIAFLRKPDPDTICSTGFAVLSPILREVDPKFLFYFVSSDPFIGEIIARSEGVSYPAITPEKLFGLECKFPSLLVQRLIAALLDEKTAKIDTLIEKKRRLIELLSEERQAVINHAVTKGMNPNAKMKPSGIEWLGDVPVGWEVKKLKYLVSLINKRGMPAPNTLRVENENIQSWTGNFVVSDSLSNEEVEYRMFQTGDVLFNKLRPYLAKVFFATCDGISGGELLILRPGAEIASRFLFYRMLSDSIIRIVNGSTEGAKMPRADWEFVGSLPIPSPSLKEQDAIASFLDSKTNEIDTLIEKAERAIALLTEYRTALITEAVTGRVEISSIATK